jgi:hypothetical protein
LGYVDGRDIDLVIRMAENQAERLPGLANEIVAGKPAAIVAGADAALVAAAPPRGRRPHWRHRIPR